MSKPFSHVEAPASNEIPQVKPNGLSWITLASLVLAAALLYITLRGLDWLTFWGILKGSHYGILLLTASIACINYLLRSLRWRILLQVGNGISFLQVFWANMLGYMGNSYLPARAGELLRSASLGQKSGLGTSFVLATALAERMLDALALVLIGSAALLTQQRISLAMANSLRVIGLLSLSGLALLAIAPTQERRFLSFLRIFRLPQRIFDRISEQLSRLLLGMRSLHSARRLSAFFVMTIVIWLIDAAGTTVGVRIIDQHLTVPQALVLLAGLGLSSAVPSTPGYVGVYQFVAVTVLVPFGFTRADALAYILISQVSNYLLVSALGLLALFQIRRPSLSKAG